MFTAGPAAGEKDVTFDDASAETLAGVNMASLEQAVALLGGLSDAIYAKPVVPSAIAALEVIFAM